MFGLFERWGRSHAFRYGLALLLGRLPRPAGYRVVSGRLVRVSVLNDVGERREQPMQIDGDNALTLPVSIGLSARAVRLLQPAWHFSCSLSEEERSMRDH